MPIVFVNIKNDDSEDTHGYYATWDGRKWKHGERIGDMKGDVDIRSYTSPGVAEFLGKLFIVYLKKDTPDLYYAVYDGSRWAGPFTVASDQVFAKSKFSPSLEVYNGKMYTCFVGDGKNSNTIRMAIFDRGFNAWFGGEKISTDTGDQPESAFNPSLTEFSDKLYMIYRGLSNSKKRIYYAYFDEIAWHGNQHIESPDGTVAQSDHAPSSVVLNDDLYVFFTDLDGDISFATYQGDTWTSVNKISSVSPLNPKSSGTPTAVVYQDKLYVYYRGYISSSLYFMCFDGKSWSGNTLLNASGNWDESEDYVSVTISNDMEVRTYKNWMKDLNAKDSILDVNLPGAHDAVAAYSSVSDWIRFMWVNQNETLDKQLEAGARLFDIRLEIVDDGGKPGFMTVHAGFLDYTNVGRFGSLTEKLDWAKAFLEENPTEFVVFFWRISIKGDKFTSKQIRSGLSKLFERYTTLSRNGNITVEEACGKIILFNGNYSEFPHLIGPYMHWSGNTGGEFITDTTLRYPVWAQDRWNDYTLLSSAEQEKYSYVEEAFGKKQKGTMVFNFASAIIGEFIPLGVYVNSMFVYDLGNEPKENRLMPGGWTFFDFLTSSYCTDKYGYLSAIDLIIDSNYGWQNYPDSFTFCVKSEI